MDSIPRSNAEWSTYISTIKDHLLAEETAADVVHPPPPLRPASTTTIASSIDHTLLAVDATQSQIDTLCTEAHEYGFATVCVRLNHVARAVRNLHQPDSQSQSSTTTTQLLPGKTKPKVGVACVIGFHEGTHPTEAKVAETHEAVRLGATELDMVMNWPLLKRGEYMRVYEDVVAVRTGADTTATTTQPSNATTPTPTTAAAAASTAVDKEEEKSRVLLKVILETSQLSRDEIIAGSALACMAGADFVKTSTGFVAGAGATVENVRLMRRVVDLIRNEKKKGGHQCRVKASGGVRSAEDCVRMLEAGAERIGTSSGVKIMRELLVGEREKEGGQESGGIGVY